MLILCYVYVVPMFILCLCYAYVVFIYAYAMFMACLCYVSDVVMLYTMVENWYVNMEYW